MTLRLGIDTGGTFTDSVLLDTEKGVLATNKALTTYHDLFVGINNAVSGLLESSHKHRRLISMVGLSSTLATNAMVENHGRNACLIYIGQPDHVVNNSTLNQAIGEDSTITIKGGHNAGGEAIEDLDVEMLKWHINNLKTPVAGFAVAGYFSVRNAEHELIAKKIITELTGLPVTCSHELTSKLDAPKRALTCLFNARLIPLLTALINSVEKLLVDYSINVPIMVVQGDGSLVEARQALYKPVETILSGPAASLHGARYLSNIDNAIVSDIGGTTTDVALLEHAAPNINVTGAIVGGWRTMVEAVSVNTRGLGGDSEVLLKLGVPTLSTQRSISLCQLADEYPKTGIRLQKQLESDSRETDTRFAVKLREVTSANIFRSASEKRVYDLLTDGPIDLNTLLESPAYERALIRLRQRGIVNIAAFTPTDALHVLGRFQKWNSDHSVNAAKLICRLIERQSDSKISIEALCEKIIELVVDNSCRILLETVVIHTYKQRSLSKDMNAERLSKILLEQPDNIFFDSSIKLKQPIIAIGAPASMFYPQVAKKFATRCIIPKHAEVCNAVGAVTSKVIQKVHAFISSPQEGTFRVHLSTSIKDFNNLHSALEHGKQFCVEQAQENARLAGAISINTRVSHKEVFINEPGGHQLFIESEIVATAEGEPADINVTN